MKASFFSLKNWLMYGVVLFIAISCKNEEEQTPQPKYTYNFSTAVLSTITKKQLDDFRNAKMPIYQGNRPPEIFDILLTNKSSRKIIFTVENDCIYDNKIASNANSVYGNYIDTISISLNTIDSSYMATLGYASVSNDVKYRNGLDTGSGVGYASGDGSNFTAFFNIKNGIYDKIPYEALWVISGTVTRNNNDINPISGINNLHSCLLMIQKGEDPDNKLAAVGTIRIFKDKDGKSERKQ